MHPGIISFQRDSPMEPFADLVSALWPGIAIWRHRYGQQWLGLWLVAWRHEAIVWTIVWTNVETPVSQEMCEVFLLGMSLKITNLKSQMHLPETNA